MSTAEIVESLKHVSNSDRLVIIEAATRLLRQEWPGQAVSAGSEDPILQVAGCLSGNPLSASDIDKELYGEGLSS